MLTSLQRNVLIYGLLALFAAWCVIGFHRDVSQIHMAPVLAAWPAILAATLLSLLNYALRTVRWRLYMSKLGHRLSWRFVTLTFMSGFAFTLSPGKLGEMVRARYYLPKGMALPGIAAAFFVERLLDLLAMVALAALLFAELDAYGVLLWIALGLVVLCMVMLALLPWPRIAASLSAQLAGHAKPPHWLQGASSLANTLVSARQFFTPGLLLAGIALGLVAWGAEAIGFKIAGDALSPVSLSWSSAAGIYAIAIIAGALSFLPGGLGSTEAVMAALLHAHGFQWPDAILLTLVCRLLTLWLAVLIGWLCVWALKAPSSP